MISTILFSRSIKDLCVHCEARELIIKPLTVVSHGDGGRVNRGMGVKDMLG